MTSIKPPSSGTSGPHAVPERADVSGGSPQADGPESSSFERSLAEANQANQAQQVAASGGTAASGTDVIGQLAHAVESGAVTLDQAVDRLVSQTLERASSHLTSVQREELSELLRTALLSDPTLAALRD